MNIAFGHIKTRTQKVAVSFEVLQILPIAQLAPGAPACLREDWILDTRESDRHKQFLKDCQEAERRGGNFFAQFGQIVKERKAK